MSYSLNMDEGVKKIINRLASLKNKLLVLFSTLNKSNKFEFSKRVGYNAYFKYNLYCKKIKIADLELIKSFDVDNELISIYGEASRFYKCTFHFHQGDLAKFRTSILSDRNGVKEMLLRFAIRDMKNSDEYIKKTEQHWVIFDGYNGLTGAHLKL